jgi:hypothetical protein
MWRVWRYAMVIAMELDTMVLALALMLQSVLGFEISLALTNSRM